MTQRTGPAKNSVNVLSTEYSITENILAVLDSSTTLVRGPARAVRAINKALNAVEFVGGFWMVFCEQIPGLEYGINLTRSQL